MSDHALAASWRSRVRLLKVRTPQMTTAAPIAAASPITAIYAARSPQPGQLRLRSDEGERGPAARTDRALEPRAGPRGVSPDQVPVADAVAQGGDRDVGRVGSRHHAVRTHEASIQPQSPRVRVVRRQRIRDVLEQGLSLGPTTRA